MSGNIDVVAGALGIDLSKFRQRKGGTEWAGNCPIHQPKRNGTVFSYAQDGKFNCFSCGAKGRGSTDLAMAVRGVGFTEAVNILTPYANRTIVQFAKGPEIKQLQVVPTENQPFIGTYQKFKAESAWLKERGLTPETCERYGVFEYRNDSRKSIYNGSVMLKIRRYSDGQGVGYLSRNIGEVTPEKPKYRFPEGLSRGLELFGAWQLKEDHKLPLRIVYVVESPFAVCKFHQMGLPAVSPFGWSLTVGQCKILAEIAKGCIYLPDANKRGEALAQAGHIAYHVWRKMPYFAKEDPEELTFEEIKSLT